MQITNNLSSNLFTSYALQKKETNKESQMTSRFVNIETEKTSKAELVMRPKTDALQSQIEQMKKEYLEGGYDNDLITTSWGSTTITEYVLRNEQISIESLQQQYPNYSKGANAYAREYGRDLLDLKYYWSYKPQDSTQNASKSDFNNALQTIETAVTQLLEQEFEKDQTSDKTNALILFKAQVQSIPIILEQMQQKVSQLSKQEGTDLQSLQTEYYGTAFAEIVRLEDIATKIGKDLPELKEQLDDSSKIFYDYFYTHWKQDFSVSGISKLDTSELKEALESFTSNLVSRFSAIDNTEMLLNLLGDSHLQTSTNKSKSYESLIDTIRAKLKTTDDSILQKLMNGKTANQAKAAEASA